MSKNQKTTLLDYAILGLIRKEGMTGYRIRKTFEETELGNYSSSPGTIYPALKRLENLGLAEKRLDKETGKSAYYITANGSSALLNWLIRPIDYREVEREREELLLRFAFMDEVNDREIVLDFLNSFRNHLITYLAELEVFHQQHSSALPVYGRLAFEHGIFSAKATLKWCKRTINELSKNSKQ